MNQVKFFNPKSLPEVLKILDEYRQEAVIVNGGTDIVEKIANRSISPKAIAYIQNIAELKGIRQEEGYVCIGGAATYNEVARSPLSKQFSVLRQAIAVIGSLPIRVVATPAGNVGTAVPAADCNVALLALNAEFILANTNGERLVHAKDMFVGYCRTKLEPAEIIKEIRIPVLHDESGSAFVKLAKRKAQDIAQVSVGVRLTVDGDICRDVCIALGAVSSTTVRAYSLEGIMRGQQIAAGTAKIKETFPAEANLRNPRNKFYKEAVIGVIASRAIDNAYAEILGVRK